MAQKRPSVLVVDDVEANLVALEALIGDMDCELVRARGGNDALKHLLKREFAVMLLDVQMPEMDGYEVATFARQNPRTREVPIIFLTAMHNSEAGMLRGYGTGAVDFLFKPLNAHVLRAKVRVFLDLYVSKQKLSAEVLAHKQTLRELELANTALRHFTQAAAHDLKAPLRAVRGLLEALSSEVGSSLEGMAREYLERSLKAGQRMDSLLNALSTYARLQRPVAHVQVDCNAVLQHVQEDLADRIAASQATLNIGELPTVTGDPDRLYQLFFNLVGNALKFQRPGERPSVSVRAAHQGATTIFCVEDNGIGIDAKHRTKVFDAFLRLHDESRYQGTGLGLAICQHIVEQHHGRMWVESELGSGSRFFVELARGAPMSAEA